MPAEPPRVTGNPLAAPEEVPGAAESRTATAVVADGEGAAAEPLAADEAKLAGAPAQPAQGPPPIRRKAKLAAMQRGRALAERLKDAEPRLPGFGRGDTLKLTDVRGGKGCLLEGALTDLGESTRACCFSAGKREAFFAVRGPWLLKFRDDTPEGKALGVPIPLEGASVTPVGEKEFDVSNVHIKNYVFGAGAFKQLRVSSKTFEHMVEMHLAASSKESRDEWVQVLNTHIGRLRDRLARKLQSQDSQQPGARSRGSQCSGSKARTGTVESSATVRGVNRVAVALFAEFEEDEENLWMQQRQEGRNV